jgi:hypothetical protein
MAMRRSTQSPQVLTSARIRCLLGAAAPVALLIGGCVSNSSATYPDTWSARTAVSKSECPHLAGRYHDTGETALASRAQFCGGGRLRGEWHCEASLLTNIADDDPAEWVELRQPNADTLIVVSSDPTIEVKELHQSRGDFTCTAKGLERHLHASLMSEGNNGPSSAPAAIFNGVSTAFNLVSAGSAGVRSLTRTFKTAADGSLILDVSESQSGLMVLIPMHTSEESYVRWLPVAGAPVDSAVPADLPSAHVARFISMNDFLHHTRVSGVDGSGVDKRRGEGKPVSLAPGARWVEVKTIDHSFRPLLDYDVSYSFELEAAAGHVYRLARRPASCLAPGDLKSAVASHQVGRTQVSLIDQAPGMPERPFDVEALCIVGLAASCDVSDTGEVLDGLVCLRLNPTGRGYYGRPTGILSSL